MNYLILDPNQELEVLEIALAEEEKVRFYEDFGEIATDP